MSYNPNIPNIGDFTAVSQKQILANFQAINTSWLIDHVPLTAVEDVGKHNALTLRPQTVDPTTTANQSAIYNKIVSTVPELFFRPSTNQTPIQLTNPNLNTLQTGAPGGSQSSFLAGPFTIYFGFFFNVPVAQLVTLLPASTLVYVGLATVVNAGLPGSSQLQGNKAAIAVNISGNQFTIARPATSLNNPTVYYMAIGR